MTYREVIGSAGRSVASTLQYLVSESSIGAPHFRLVEVALQVVDDLDCGEPLGCSSAFWPFTSSQNSARGWRILTRIEATSMPVQPPQRDEQSLHRRRAAALLVAARCQVDGTVRRLALEPQTIFPPTDFDRCHSRSPPDARPTLAIVIPYAKLPAASDVTRLTARHLTGYATADRGDDHGDHDHSRADMSVWHAIILGLVQGVTEFIPISSSGHLILVPWLFHWHSLANSTDLNKTFDVALHLGTFIAVLVYFWRDIGHLLAAFFGSLRRRRIESPDERVAWLLLISTIPAGLVGVGPGELHRGPARQAGADPPP